MTSTVPRSTSPVKRYLDRAAIRRIRVKHGYATDRALAAAVGVRAEHMSSCLAGRYTAGPRLLDGLLRALPGADVDDISQLCTVTEIRTPVSPTTRNPSACDAGHTAAR